MSSCNCSADRRESRLRPCHASVIGGGQRNSPSSLAKFAVIRRASSHVKRLVAERSDAAIRPDWMTVGGAKL